MSAGLPIFSSWLSFIFGGLSLWVSWEVSLIGFLFLFLCHKHGGLIFFWAALGVGVQAIFLLSLSVASGLETIPTANNSEAEVVRVTDYGSQIRIGDDLFYASRKLKKGERIKVSGRYSYLSSQDTESLSSWEWRRSRKSVVGKLKDITVKQRQAQDTEFVPPISIAKRYFNALFKGQTDSINQEEWELFHYLGISHLFVFSGLHVGLLFLLLMGVVSIFLPPRFQATKSWVVLLLSCAILQAVEFGIPAWRASLLLFIFIFARHYWPLLYRYPKTEIVAAVGLVFVVVDPGFLLEKSYLLSFGITWALLRCYEQKHSPLLYPVGAFCCASVVLYVFGNGVHPLSWLLNFSLWILFPVFFVSLGVGMASGVQFVDDSLSRCIQFFIKSLENLQSVWMKIDLGIAIHPLFQLSVSFLVLIYLVGISKKSLLLVGGGMALLIMVSLGVPRPELEIDFLDVGQGDAIVVRLGSSRFLIDGGKDSRLLSELRLRGHHHFRSWVITHFDQDHVGAFEHLRQRLVFDELWLSGEDFSKRGRELFKQMQGHPMRYANQERLEFCEGPFCLAAWTPRSKTKSSRIRNADSLVIYVYQKSTQELVSVFLADATKGAESRFIRYIESSGLIVPKRLALLKVAHHGSTTSTREELLEFFKPQNAVITSGRHNAYGFPKAVILDRLHKWEAKIKNTAAVGHFRMIFSF